MHSPPPPSPQNFQNPIRHLSREKVSKVYPKDSQKMRGKGIF